jgi:hypothetical protein
MRIVLELTTPAAVALARRAVRHRRPVALEALRLIELSLGCADCDCLPRRADRGTGEQAEEVSDA